MADDLKNRGPADASRINVNEDHEIRYWCKALKVDPQRLRAAVEKAGPMADDVRRELAR